MMDQADKRYEKQYYRDKYGDVWLRFNRLTVRRLRDGNWGGFFDGKGLTRDWNRYE